MLAKKFKSIIKKITLLALSAAIALPAVLCSPLTYTAYAAPISQAASGIYFDGQWIVGIDESYEYITEDAYNKHNGSTANNAYWSSLSSSGGKRPDGTPYFVYSAAVKDYGKLQVLSAWYGQTVYFRQRGTSGTGTAVSIPKYSDLGTNQYKTAIRVCNVRATDVDFDFYSRYTRALYDNVTKTYKGIDKNININFNDAPIENFNRNSRSILTDAEGNFLYDLVTIGPYPRKIADISDVAAWTLRDYLNEGYGLLVGHDAMYGEPGVNFSGYIPSTDSTNTRYYEFFGEEGLGRYGPWNVNWLVGVNKLYTHSRPYETLSLILSSSSKNDKGNNKHNIFGNTFGNLSSLKIAAVQDGNPQTDLGARCPTNYPYNDISPSFYGGATNTHNQLAYGTVWVDFNQTNTYGRHLTDKNEGLTGTNNFYLTTNGNIGMIQAGHSVNADAGQSFDEAKLLLNTILYLSQRDTCAICESGQGGNTDKNSVIRISSSEELALIGKAGYEVQYPIDGCYILTSKIELPINWEPIQNFRGHFNANNFDVVNHGKPMFANGVRAITVTYNGNGGKFGASDVNNVVYIENQITNGTYRVPVKPDGKFVGWYTDANCTPGNEFDVNNAQHSITVYAKWQDTTNIGYLFSTGAKRVFSLFSPSNSRVIPGPAAGTNPNGWNLGTNPEIGYPNIHNVSGKTTGIARVTGSLRRLFRTDIDVNYSGYKVVITDLNGTEYSVTTNKDGRYTISNIPPMPSVKLTAKIYKPDGTQLTEYGDIYCIIAGDAWNNNKTTTLQLEAGYIAPIMDNTIYEGENCTFVVEYPAQELPESLLWYYHDDDTTRWVSIAELQAKGLKIKQLKPTLVPGTPTLVRATITLEDVDIRFAGTHFKAVVKTGGEIKDTFESRKDGYTGRLIVKERPWEIYPVTDMEIWQGDDFQFTAQLTHYKSFDGGLTAKWQYNTGTDRAWYDFEASAFFDDVQVNNTYTVDPANQSNYHNLSTLKVKNAKAVINGFKFRCVFTYGAKNRYYYTNDVATSNYEGKLTVKPLDLACVEHPKRIELITNGANATGEYEFTSKFTFTSPDGKIDVKWLFKPNQEGTWQDISQSPFYGNMRVETARPIVHDETANFSYIVTSKLIIKNPPIGMDSGDNHYYFKAVAQNKNDSVTSRTADILFRHTIDIVPNEPFKKISNTGKLTVYSYPKLKVHAIHGLTKFSVKFSSTTGSDTMSNSISFKGITALPNGKGFTYAGKRVTTKEVEDWLRNMQFSITSDNIEILWSIEDEMSKNDNATPFENNMYEVITIPLSDDPAVSYSEAEEIAKAIGKDYGTDVHLVKIDSERENIFISKLLQESGVDIAWIGNVIDNENKSLLWSNPSTNLSPQTINLDFSRFSKIQIVFRAYPNIVTQEYNPKGNEEFYLTIDKNDLSNKIAYFDYNDSKYIKRDVQLTTNGIRFGSGIFGNIVNNAVAVPFRVYGITNGDMMYNPSLLKEVIYNPYNSNATVDMNKLGITKDPNASFPHGTKYSEENVHRYEYVENTNFLMFEDARRKALMRRNEELGEFGYLATLTSLEETNSTGLPGFGYIGAYLAPDSCLWYWLDGPKSETSTPFYQQPHTNSGFVDVNHKLFWGYFPSKSNGKLAHEGHRIFLFHGPSGEWDEDQIDGGHGYHVEWNSDISMMHSFVIEYAAFDDGYIHADKIATAKDTVSHKGISIIIPPSVETKTEYRTNTNVIISCDITAIADINPDNPAKVKFEITNPDGKKTTKVFDNVILPAEKDTRAYVEHFTGEKPGTMIIDITVEGNIVTDTHRIVAVVGELKDNPPPDPGPKDTTPDGFVLRSTADDKSQTVHSWTSYTCETDGTDWYYTEIENRAELIANAAILPDSNSPTASIIRKTMKSGYGITEVVTPTIKTESSECTPAQTVLSFFPEFEYATYWRLMEKTNSNIISPIFEFKNNEYSLMTNRVHFTPIWFPDGPYRTYVTVRDAWTPVGELKASITSDEITIKDSLHDDWFVKN